MVVSAVVTLVLFELLFFLAVVLESPDNTADKNTLKTIANNITPPAT